MVGFGRSSLLGYAREILLVNSGSSHNRPSAARVQIVLAIARSTLLYNDCCSQQRDQVVEAVLVGVIGSEGRCFLDHLPALELTG